MDGNESKETPIYVPRQKQTNRAMAHSLSDAMKPVVDVSISVYRAILANGGGFLDINDKTCAAAKAIMFASKMLNVKIKSDEDYNTIINLVHSFYLHVTLLIIFFR